MDNFNVPGGTVDDAIGPIADEAVALAGYPNVSIKLSGMSGCSTEPYPFANINPYLQKLIEAFEPRRCFWGTDFTRLPILDRCTYGETVTHFTEQMDFLGEEDKEWIMGRAVSEFLDWPID
jgi:L-fuconolactonase